MSRIVQFAAEYTLENVVHVPVAYAYYHLRDEDYDVSLVNHNTLSLQFAPGYYSEIQLEKIAGQVSLKVASQFDEELDAGRTVHSTVGVDTIQIELRDPPDTNEDLIDKGLESAMHELGGLQVVLEALGVIEQGQLQVLIDNPQEGARLEDRVEELVVASLQRRGLRVWDGGAA